MQKEFKILPYLFIYLLFIYLLIVWFIHLNRKTSKMTDTHSNLRSLYLKKMLQLHTEL